MNERMNTKIWKEEKQSKLSALGRNTLIGELYDARTETLSSRSLFKSSLPSDSIKTLDIAKTEVKYKFTENISDRFELLDVEAELQISILCGLINVSGSGHYLTTDKNSQKVTSCSLICKCLTVCQKFFKAFDEILEHIDVTALENPSYTHVVVETIWGGNCILQLEAAHNTESEKKKLEGSLKAEVEKIVGAIECKGGGRLESSSSANSSSHNISVNVTADVLPENRLPTSIEDFQNFMVNFPNLLKAANDGKGIILNFVVIPLTSIRKVFHLESKIEVAVQAIDGSFLISMIYFLEEIAILKRRFSDLIKELKEFEKYLTSDALKRARNKEEELKMSESNLKVIISDNWTNVKSGRKPLKELIKEVEKFKYEKLPLCSYEDFFDSYAPLSSKISVIKRYMSAGAYYLGRKENFSDFSRQHPNSEFFVLVVSSDLQKKNTDLYDNVSFYFMKLLNEKKNGSKYVVVDLDLTCDTSSNMFSNITEPKCIHLKDMKVLSSDVLDDYIIETQSNFAQLKQGTNVNCFRHKPGNRVLLNIICPGFQLGSCPHIKVNWRCFKCKSDLEYGFDRQFYCLCGGAPESCYTFRCNNPKHGSAFLSPDIKFLQKELSDLKPFKELNVLILGQSGVGKSTWINSIVNYLEYETLENAKEGGVLCEIPIREVIYDEKTLEKYIIEIGKSTPNEVTDIGSSGTQVCHTYSFLWEDRYVRLIDSPGLGDTRGIDQDKKNMAKIVDYLGVFTELHAICILIKSSENRTSTIFSYCLKELLVHLHKSVARNIVFCFTNARFTMYRLGSAANLLENLLNDMDVKISVGPHNMFFLDNEAFVFLCISSHPKVSYNNDLVESFGKSWNISLKETRRLFTTIKNYEAHTLKETLSLVTARNRILALGKPVAEISKTIQMNLASIESQKKEINLLDQTLTDLKKKLEINEIHLESTTLPRPRTVCTAPRCVEYITYVNSDISDIHYKTHCHEECYITEVTPKTTNNHLLRGCAAMSNGVCNVCGCNWQVHMHITTSQKRVEKPVVNKKVESQMKDEESIKKDIENVLRELQSKTDEYQKEQDFIVQASVKFGMFLSQNAISVYNDSVGEVLKYLIHEEEKKPVKTKGDENLLKKLKETLEYYEAEVEILQQAIEKGANNCETLNAEDVLKLEKELYKLKLCGKAIKQSVLASRAGTLENFTYAETPLVITRKHKTTKKAENTSLFSRTVDTVKKKFTS